MFYTTETKLIISKVDRWLTVVFFCEWKGLTLGEWKGREHMPALT